MNPARDSVEAFYRQNHQFQTLDFARTKFAQWGSLGFERMGIWDACEQLDTLIDDSDPDTSLSQLQHLLQSAEAARADDQPDWFVLAALIHDLGKLLCLRGEPQWAVVGDTFPLGCAFDPAVIYHKFFADNPDSHNPEYQTATGIYEPGCGFNNLTMSWGHDEYMYQVAKPYLPDDALYLIRFHSFYATHDKHAYAHLMDDTDRQMRGLLTQFSSYDLYSKADEPPDVENLKPYYQALIRNYFPDQIDW